ncbi:hypothetical protein HG536_0C02600 [Torulaspora globosa]|uniref:Uncharacterized protein n=1 Tax=Torulaspora globosa TaxID=48254 RepID=A0A7G3ZF05_9SACH|nr:uncharacterized protein HG536_0C02600 [Torulaspora globosa]QLL32091.1 hypothetical protein HG536_0C02600 [Torulaspora globosa]
MNQDQETTPLLDRRQRVEVSEDTEYLDGKNARGRRWIKWVVICVLALILAGLTAFGAVLVKKIPSQDAIEDSVIRVSNWQIEKVNVDGWRRGETLNNEDGDALQLTVRMDYWPNFDGWIADNSTLLTLHDKKLYRSVSERFVRSICLTVNNATTYDGAQTVDNILGALQVRDTFCVDLRNNVRSHLNLTVLVEPRMDKILEVLKKIWRHEFDKLQISSEVDLSLSRRMVLLPNGWDIPVYRLHALQIDWKRLISWDNVKDSFNRLRHRFAPVSIQNFSLTDSTNGFHLETTTVPLSLGAELDFVEFPKDSVVPFIDWEIKLADCMGEFTIALPNVFCFTDSVEIRDDIQPKAFADIEGSLPKQLLSQVCWSDEENAFTPMTLLLNKVLNASDELTFQVKGHVVNSTKDSNALIPRGILQSFLDDMSFFPISTNLTIDSADLIQRITISKLKAKWVRGLFGERRLSVTGTFIGTIALPFYESSKEQISVEYIKGKTRLYHQKVHFLTVPMSYWSKCSSEIYRNEENTTTFIELSVEVRDDEVKIINNLELTRVLNEVLFRGEAQVHLDSELDLLVSTPVGEMVLLGLKGKGNATLRS